MRRGRATPRRPSPQHEARHQLAATMSLLSACVPCAFPSAPNMLPPCVFIGAVAGAGVGNTAKPNVFACGRRVCGVWLGVCGVCVVRCVHGAFCVWLGVGGCVCACGPCAFPCLVCGCRSLGAREAGSGWACVPSSADACLIAWRCVWQAFVCLVMLG